MKKLYKSKNDAVISGVCGGLAEYFNIDSFLVRLLFVLFSWMGFFPVFLYLILMLTLPEKP